MDKWYQWQRRKIMQFSFPFCLFIAHGVSAKGQVNLQGFNLSPVDF